MAARLLGGEAYGVDVAPEAVVCTSAKLAAATMHSVESYLATLRTGRPSLADVPSDVQLFFHKSTLQQLISVNRHLQRTLSEGTRHERSVATIIQAALLGILHGHASYSLSISSAHAFAMAPNYVRNYARDHGIKAPERDVKKCLLQKLSRCLAQPLPRAVVSKVVRGRAQDIASLLPDLQGRVDCVLTSPPYLASHTYAKDNWLRHWLLGYDYRDLSCNYLQTGSIQRYETEMQSVLGAICELLRPGGVLILVIGHGRRDSCTNETSVNMKGIFRRLLKERQAQLQSEYAVTEHIISPRRYYHSLSTTKGHTADERREYVLVARRR